jgi:hypothetical protein
VAGMDAECWEGRVAAGGGAGGMEGASCRWLGDGAGCDRVRRCPKLGTGADHR